MNRRSYVVLAGSLLTAGCTGSSPTDASSNTSTRNSTTSTNSTQTGASTSAQSLKTAAIGSESDLPENVNDRTIQLFGSKDAVTVVVSKIDSDGFEERYDVPANTNFRLDVFVPADYTVTVQATEGRSKTVEVTEDSFTCTSSITNVYVPESESIRVVEHDPEASCDDTGTDAAANGTATTVTTTPK